MPSFAPTRHPDALLTDNLRILRGQAAVVRSFVDEVEQGTRDARMLRVAGEQLVEELARLGCNLMEAAAGLARGAG